MTTPMTAAEYRREWPKSLEQGINGSRNILAALEDRERLLATVFRLEGECEKWKREARVPSAHARVGALVAAIREHKMFKGAAIWMPNDGSWHVPHLSDSQLEGCLSHLDSLLPKEPEPAPSGRTYKFEDGWLKAHVRGNAAVQVIQIQAEDREFVAALLGGRNGK